MSSQKILKVIREREAESSRNEFNELFKEAKSEAKEVTNAIELALVSKAFRTAFAILAEVLIGSQRMVRRVGPNERPEERYEFENSNHTNLRGPGSRVF